MKKHSHYDPLLRETFEYYRPDDVHRKIAALQAEIDGLKEEIAELKEDRDMLEGLTSDS